MPIITLTSDWGLKDYYLASVKGAIFTRLQNVNVVDISHNIQKFNILQAAFIVRNCYKNFPEKTVHIIAVDTEASIQTPHTLVIADNQFFIAADTGIFSLIFDKPPDTVYEITSFQDSNIFTFPARDVFVKVACHLAIGGKAEELGVIRSEFNKLTLFKPVINEDSIRGVVLYVDSYENVITNITEKQFREIGKGRKFEINFRGESIKAIHKSYGDVTRGEMLAVFGSTGLLEISINKGNAGGLLGLEVNETIRIEFK